MKTPLWPACVALVLGLGLACSGVGLPEIPGAKAPEDRAIDQGGAQPSPAPAPDGASGLAVTLGLPKQGGELVVSEAEKVRIIHRDAWDVAKIWPLYHDAFVADGWERLPSNVPPFESLYERDDTYIDLRMDSAGPTVTVDIDRKPRPK
jgi:hypothetical protein